VNEGHLKTAGNTIFWIIKGLNEGVEEREDRERTGERHGSPLIGYWYVGKGSIGLLFAFFATLRGEVRLLG